jgi:zinc/manganese transport system substrate-binding protein/manganese/iron transport system substrate-binding protein
MARTKAAKATVTLATAILAAGCGSSHTTSPASEAHVVEVVSTTTQVTDFVRAIGGADVHVHAVLKANVDPHDFEPTPADLDAIAKADVVVKNGIGLEKWFEQTIADADPRGTIVEASEGVAVRSGDGSNEEKEGDPHIWHNPQNAKVMVTNIARALAAADPGAKGTFDANLASYIAALDALDTHIKSQIDALTNKKLVTNHDAFGYYVEHYGLDYVGSVIPSFDSQAELSPHDINDLVAKIKAQGVKAVFSEASLPPKTAAAIAAEAGVKVVAGDDALYGDTLGPPGSDGDTYLKMMAHNTNVIVDNLK